MDSDQSKHNPVRVHIFSPEMNILERFCDELIQNQHQFDAITVILATLRQANLVRACLAQKCGSTRLPKISSLDAFIFAQSGAEFADQMIASAFEEETLLSSIIRGQNLRFIPAGSEHELRQFFCDLYEHGLETSWREQAEDYLLQLADRDPDVIRHLRGRFDEVEQIRLLFERQLTHSNVVPMEQMRRRRCLFLGAHAQRLWGNGERLYLVGFSTLKSYAAEMFAGIAKLVGTSFWFMQQPSLIAQARPLESLYQRMHVPFKFYTEQKPLQPCLPWQLHECANHLAQVSLACQLVTEYVQAGVSPSAIGILLPVERARASLVRSVVHAQPWPANIAITLTFDQSCLGHWLQLCARLNILDVAEPSFAHALRAWLVHPISTQLLWEDSAGLGVLHMHRLCSSLPLGGWEDILVYLQQQTAVKWRSVGRYLQKVNDLRLRLQELIGQQKSFTLQDGVRTFCQYLSEIGVWQVKSHDRELLLESSLSALAAMLWQWQRIGEIQALRFSTVKSFWHFVLEKMPQFEVRNTGYSLEGVQVLQFTEARLIPFEVVVVLDCVEGYLPRALPRDHLVDNSVKKAVGLPGWGYVEALEETNFRLLTSQTQHVHLMVPMKTDGRSLGPSRFVEHALHRKQAVWSEVRAPFPLHENKDHQQYTVPRYDLAHLGLQPDNPAQWFRQIAVTDLEVYFQCPYRFALGQLGLRGRRSALMESAAQEGERLHKVLELFFSEQACGPQGKIAPLRETVPKEKWPLYAQERLQSLTESVFPAHTYASPIKDHLDKISWPKWVANFGEFWGDGPVLTLRGKCQTEVRLGGGEGVTLNVQKWFGEAFADLKITIRGQIDCIRRCGNQLELIDYKRRSIPSVKDMKQGRVVQLVLYSLALSEEIPDLDFDRLRVSYWNIFDGLELAAGWGTKISLSSLVDEMIAKWRRSMEQHLILRRPWQPTPGKHCVTCPYQGVCRIGERQVEELLTGG
ncbi:MAG: PD-(D/E)XK nuclease family protein [Zetaproteobacteria bacterium]|nr:PD-(D/E)XK nuclease family protein [Zetaproteobacteria bacterium]